ncbi:MAG TPA: VOC family protein [Candidatus Eisenbacteria bacterium]|nr:VOC family protein [Candidatus Eisenbacteria bacterium]
MLLGIDHLVFAVGDLDAATAELERSLGLAAGGGGRHPAFGTQNRLVWLGDTYLELVSIADPNVAEGSWFGSLVAASLEHGDGLVTWAVASDSLESDVAALQAFGSSLGAPTAGERRRDDGSVVRWQVSLPDRLGPGEPPFVIEHDPASAEWTPADQAARRDEPHPIGGPVRLEVLELPTGNVPATIQRLTRTLGLRFRPSLAGHGARDANLGSQIVRLRPAPGTRFAAPAAPPAATPEAAAPAPGTRSAAPTVRLASPAGDDRIVTAIGCKWVLRRSG